MKRRNLFKLACCAVAASAIEVMGWAGVAVTHDEVYAAAEPPYSSLLFDPDMLFAMPTTEQRRRYLNAVVSFRSNQELADRMVPIQT